jgi:L-threonylcarbamoyladenylate synthase
MWVTMPDDPAGYAERLYAVLHRLDDAGATDIVIEEAPDGPEWAGIRDRITRASR